MVHRPFLRCFFGALQGEICDLEGRCIDAAEDEMFKLTTKEGRLTMEREKVTTDTSDFDAGLIFEQDPVQILDAILPLYLNSTLLRSLQARPSPPHEHPSLASSSHAVMLLADIRDSPGLAWHGLSTGSAGKWACRSGRRGNTVCSLAP